MKKTLSIVLIILVCVFCFADVQSFTGNKAGSAQDKDAGSGEAVSPVLRNVISGINPRNKWEKVSEFLDSNRYLSEEAIDLVRQNIPLTPEGERNPVHDLLDNRIEDNSRINTASRHLKNVMDSLSNSTLIRIQPNARYQGIKSNIDIIDEKLNTGLRGNDLKTFHSIAEYVALKSKGYSADNLSNVVTSVRQHMSNFEQVDGKAVQAATALFDSYDQGMRNINEMKKADDIVSEAATNLRTDDNLGNNIDRIRENLLPMTNIEAEGDNTDQDGDLIHDIVYYAQRMNKESPRTLPEHKKVHMNMLLDLLKDEVNRDAAIDNNGSATGEGGGLGDFIGKITSFFQIATQIIGIISDIFFDGENPLGGLASYFDGLPEAGGLSSNLGIGSGTGSGTGSSPGSGSASFSPSGSTSARPSGPGLQRIIQSAEGAVGQGRGGVHGITCYTATTEWGNLACAAVVSAILSNANAGLNEQILYCPTFENTLPGIGYRENNYPSQSEFTAGDVVFWAKSGSGRARHVGVITEKDVYNKWWGVDNSSTRREVVRRPVIRSYYPVVKSIYTYTQ